MFYHYTPELDNTTGITLHVYLFKNVRNTKELRARVMSGDLKCCFIKPSLMCELLQIVVAANKAVTAPKTTTKSIYTEILFNLSPSKNITQSLQMFGIGDDDTNLLLVTLSKKGEEEGSSAFDAVEGEEVDVSNLLKFTDMKAVREIYKISEKESETTGIRDSIISRIACKELL